MGYLEVITIDPRSWLVVLKGMTREIEYAFMICFGGLKADIYPRPACYDPQMVYAYP